MDIKSTDVRQSVGLQDLFAIEQLAASFPGVLTVQTLRWQLRHRDTNGLAAACIRIGKKLFISKTRYEEWLASMAEGAK